MQAGIALRLAELGDNELVFRVPRSQKMMNRLLGLSRLTVLIGLQLAVCTIGCGGSPEQSLDELRAMQTEQRFEDTILPLKRLLAEKPDDLELNRLLGLALKAADGPSTSVWALRRVTEHPEHSTNDLFVLAQAYARGGVQSQGIATLDSVLEIEPDHLGALALRMTLAAHLKRWDKVVDSADRVLVLDPNRPMVHLSRAEALLALERVDEASAALATGRAVIATRSVDPSIEISFCRLEVEVAEESGGSDAVEEIWGACLERTQGSAKLVSNAVAFFDERGDRARATSLLRQALEEAPFSLELRAQLADRLDADGRSEEAVQLLLAATEFEENPLGAWLVVADFHRQRENHAAAARATEHVLRAREAVPTRLMAEYGDDLVRAGELTKAEEVIGKIDRPEWAALLRGRLLLERGEAAEAFEQLQEGIRLWPSNGTARLLAGRAAERLGDFDRAISEYRDSVRSEVESMSAVNELVGLYEAEGRYQSALFPLTLRLQRDSNDDGARFEMVRVALAAGFHPTAKQAAEMLRSNGKDEMAALADAMIAAATEGPAAAAEALAAVDLDLTLGAHAELLRALVGYLLDAGREAEALSQARIAVEASPDVADFHAAHAAALRALERDTDAEQAYERALALDPGSAEVLAGLAELRADQDRRDEAIVFYDRATSADPDDPAAAWAAILLAVETEPAPDIDARLEALLFAHPRHAQAANLLARRLLEQGADLERAEQFARRAMRFRGGAEAIETAGRIALAQGDTARAIRTLRLSLERRPQSPTTRYYLAKALIEAGEIDAARSALEAALAAGDFPEAQAAHEEFARLEKESDDG